MPEFFEGRRPIATVSLLRENGKVRLDIDVSREWVEILCRTVKCGTSFEITMTKRRGVVERDFEDLKSVMKGTIGVGIAELESSICARTGREISLELMTEVSETFKVQAPKCGRRTVNLFQLQERIDLRYEDNRVFHRNRWSKTVRRWIEAVEDRSPPIVFDSSCNCGVDEEPAALSGLLRFTDEHLGFLAGYREEGAELVFPDLDARCLATLDEILAGEVEFAPTILPDYFAFLTGPHEDILVGTFAPALWTEKRQGRRMASRISLRRALATAGTDDRPRPERRAYPRDALRARAIVREKSQQEEAVPYEMTVLDASYGGIRVEGPVLAPIDSAFEIEILEGTFSGKTVEGKIVRTERSASSGQWYYGVQLTDA